MSFQSRTADRSAEDDGLDDELVARMALYDEGLAGGADPSFLDAAPVSPAIKDQWQKLQGCLRQLGRVRSPRSERIPSSYPFPFGMFGRFIVRRELGRGGFGVVFLADDPLLGRPVALKLPRPETLVNLDLRQRFLREAQAAAALDHPNLVSVYEAGEIGGICFIASAFCPGVDLARWLKENPAPMPPRTAAALVACIAAAVQHAHDRGILHRDLKPGNILMIPTEEAIGPSIEGLDHIPKLTDFGLAKLAEVDDWSTVTGVILGTPQYMAPEQAEGWADRVGAPTDIYALGVILYELITGHLPYPGGSLLVTLEQIRSGQPTRPRTVLRAIPNELETICLKCLESDPRRRYQRADELAAELQRFTRGEPIRTPRTGVLSQLRTWLRRRDRIREAAVFAVFNGAITSIANAIGLSLFLSGQLQADRFGPVLFYTLLGLVCGAVMIRIGLRTARSIATSKTLWAGLVFPFLYPTYMLLGLTGWIDIGGIVNGLDPSALLAQIATVLLINAITIGSFGVALSAYYANRHRPAGLT